VAIDSQSLETLPNNFHHIIIPPFQNSSHRVYTIIQAAAIDQIDASSDILANATPFIEGKDTEFKQNHLKTPCTRFMVATAHYE
jgi:hypothetical protein